MMTPAAGISDAVSHEGAGAVNFLNAVESASKSDDDNSALFEAIKSAGIPNNEDLDKAFFTELSYCKTNFDDPRDYKMIELGFSYYNKV